MFFTISENVLNCDWVNVLSSSADGRCEPMPSMVMFLSLRIFSSWVFRLDGRKPPLPIPVSTVMWTGRGGLPLLSWSR